MEKGPVWSVIGGVLRRHGIGKASSRAFPEGCPRPHGGRPSAKPAAGGRLQFRDVTCWTCLIKWDRNAGGEIHLSLTQNHTARKHFHCNLLGWRLPSEDIPVSRQPWLGRTRRCTRPPEPRRGLHHDDKRGHQRPDSFPPRTVGKAVSTPCPTRSLLRPSHSHLLQTELTEHVAATSWWTAQLPLLKHQSVGRRATLWPGLRPRSASWLGG